MVYVAFVIDAYARHILGWRVATSMTTALVLDALDHAVWTRRRAGAADLAGLVHHRDAGSQYTAITFTQRLTEAGIDPSVGSVGDAYEASQRRESHPPLLSEPGVTVSRHRAPTVEPVGIAPCFQ
jgi:putative transposase